jgi:thymidine kinase
MKSYFELIIGCMYSGKSTRLMSIANEFEKNNVKILLVNHSSDSRYGQDNAITTHDLCKKKAFMCPKLIDIIDTPEYNQANVILIDEGQFFTDIEDVIKDILNTTNKHVVVAALNSNFKMEPFKHITNLTSRADSIVYLKAKCAFCDNSASFSMRTCIGDVEFLVGSNDMYVPVCRLHHAVK